VARIEAAPHAPDSPAYVAAGSTLTSISLDWPGFVTGSVGTGGSPIISYNLQWREAAGPDVWVDVQGQDGAHSTALAGSVSTSVTGGEAYLFRLAAANIHGWSGYSSELSVVASGVPDEPDPPSTTLDSLTVKIAWTAPGANYGGITAYKLAVVDSGGTAIEEEANCDGSTAPVLAQLYCQVPMTRLRDVYGLARGDLVQAQVRAQGRNGWGAWSSLNSAGVTVQTEPGPMTPPAEGSLTSEAQIEAEWAALTTPAETGGATIASYNLEWHAGGPDPLATWVSLAGDLSDYPGTSYVVTSGIVRGATYSFRLRARNVWGWGARSAEA